MKITHAEAIALNIPFYADHVTRAMQRASTTTSACGSCAWRRITA